MCIFCPFLYTLNFSFQIVSRGKKETSVQNVHAHAHARGDVNARNATRNRIRERDETRVCTKKRSSLKVEGRVLKKNRERTNTPYHSFLVLRGRPFEFVYFNNGASVARVHTNESFSRTHAKSHLPVFLSHSTEEMRFDALARFSSAICAHSRARLARTQP